MTGRHPTLDSDDLDDTTDESPRRGQTDPGRAFARPTRSELEAADLANSEWGKRIETLIEAGRAECSGMKSRVGLVEQRNRVLWRVIGGVGGVALTAAGLAIRLVYSSGESAGAATARNAQIETDHRKLEQLGREVARNTGLLEVLIPNGVLRLYGPPQKKDTDP